MEDAPAEQGVQLRDIKVFRACMGGMPVKDVAREYGIDEREVLLTVPRVDRIFRQHARRHYQAALRAERFGAPNQHGEPNF